MDDFDNKQMTFNTEQNLNFLELLKYAYKLAVHDVLHLLKKNGLDFWIFHLRKRDHDIAEVSFRRNLWTITVFINDNSSFAS